MTNIIKKSFIGSFPLTPHAKSSNNQERNLSSRFYIKNHKKRHSQSKFQYFDFKNLNPEEQSKEFQIHHANNFNNNKQKKFLYQNIYKRHQPFRIEKDQIAQFLYKKNIQIIKDNIKKMEQNDSKVYFFKQGAKYKYKRLSLNHLALTKNNNQVSQKVKRSNQKEIFSFTEPKKERQDKCKKVISFVEERKKNFQIKNNYLNLKEKRKTQNNVNTYEKQKEQKDQYKIMKSSLSQSHTNFKKSKPKTTGGWLVKRKHPISYFM